MENNTSPFAFILKLPKEYHHFEYKSGSPVIIIKQKHNKNNVLINTKRRNMRQRSRSEGIKNESEKIGKTGDRCDSFHAVLYGF